MILSWVSPPPANKLNQPYFQLTTTFNPEMSRGKFIGKKITVAYIRLVTQRKLLRETRYNLISWMLSLYSVVIIFRLNEFSSELKLSTINWIASTHSCSTHSVCYSTRLAQITFTFSRESGPVALTSLAIETFDLHLPCDLIHTLFAIIIIL